MYTLYIYNITYIFYGDLGFGADGRGPTAYEKKWKKMKKNGKKWNKINLFCGDLGFEADGRGPTAYDTVG